MLKTNVECFRVNVMLDKKDGYDERVKKYYDILNNISKGNIKAQRQVMNGELQKSGCFLSTFQVNKNNYPVMKIKNKTIRVSQFMVYIFENDNKSKITHSCRKFYQDNSYKRCVNPYHLTTKR